MNAELASAGTGALALRAAVWAGVTAKRLYDVERRRGRDRMDTELSSQAEQFAAWISWSPAPRLDMDLPPGTRSPNLALKNANPVPMYEVLVSYFDGDEPAGDQWLHIVPPTGWDVDLREIKAEAVRLIVARYKPDEPRLDLRVGLHFSDARGTGGTATAVESSRLSLAEPSDGAGADSTSS